MAVYTVENTLKIGKPVKVFDSLGAEISMCIYANTETGVIEKYAMDDDGNIVIDHDSGEAEKVFETRSAPLRVELKERTLYVESTNERK